MGIGQRIRIARARRGINSQLELHRKTGLSRPYLSLLENDESAGARKVDDLQKVAGALRVPLAWLLGMTDEEPNWDDDADGAPGDSAA